MGGRILSECAIPCTATKKAGSIKAIYRSYGYLPLYITCGRHLLAAKLRPANIDGAAGAREEVARIVSQVRERWPGSRSCCAPIAALPART